ncbi:hypothetical protein LSAT2_008841 [Lamellibrachia satsuma]|nr:hypothetical protein LSAT2_008841 [Lamellibrachia satsuma]
MISFLVAKPTTTTTTTTTPATTTTTKTPVPPFGGSTTTTIKPSDKPDKRKQTLTTGAIVGISLGAVAFIIILICCCVYFIRIRKRKSADESHPMHMDSTHRKQQVPVDQVRSPDILNPTYGRQNEFTPSLNDSVPPPTRTPEDITYADLAMMHDNQADLAIDDVPRSRKPLQVFEPGSGVEYASIQPNHRTH